MILIDTNIFIDHFRNFKPATTFFESLQERNNVLFSAITEAELVSGTINKDTEKKELLLRFLSQWNKIEVTNEIAVLAGDLRRDNALFLPDAIIAASAIINKAELITKNIKDFKDIKELKISSPY